MSLPSSARPFNTNGGIPLLNRGFEATPEEARNLWAGGEAMPENGGYVPATDQILRSADGKWVIHRLPREDAGETAASAMREFDRLQEYGIDVISRGLTPSPDREVVFAITPYIPELVVCTEEIYYARLAPKIGRYLDDPERRGGRRLIDIDRPQQHSLLPGLTDEPFLHDIHPYLSATRVL